MSLSQFIITKHAKKQINTIHNEENYQSIEIDPEMIQMIELADKDTKIVIISIFYTLKKRENSVKMTWKI